MEVRGGCVAVLRASIVFRFSFRGWVMGVRVHCYVSVTGRFGATRAAGQVRAAYAVWDVGCKDG